jgi:hypothetical protein
LRRARVDLSDARMEEVDVSCYFRHMKDILDEAGIVISPTNKKRIDQVFHQVVGTNYKDCPATWKALKQTYLADEEKRQELVRKLRAAVG